jgi:hypothetical protein
MPDPHDDVVRRFAEACRAGDAARLLHADVVATCDGGGAAAPAHGPGDVGRLVELLLCDRPGATLTVESVNGRPGLTLRRGGQALAVVALQVTDARVASLWIVLAPAKLTRWHHT